jgi:hypothetical protein
MRFRATHLTCLLLLLSSVAISAAHASSMAPVRTPGGVFVRNLLLQAAVDESELPTSGFGREEEHFFTVAAPFVPGVSRPVAGAVEQSAHVHAVTGNSL